MNRIKALRLEKGLTQAELGNIVGVIQTAIGKYERGDLEPNVSILTKLADFFGCSIDYLVGREDEYGSVNVQNDRSLSSDEEYLLVTFRKISKQRRLNLLEVATGLSKLND